MTARRTGSRAALGLAVLVVCIACSVAAGVDKDFWTDKPYPGTGSAAKTAAQAKSTSPAKVGTPAVQPGAAQQQRRSVYQAQGSARKAATPAQVAPQQSILPPFITRPTLVVTDAGLGKLSKDVTGVVLKLEPASITDSYTVDTSLTRAAVAPAQIAAPLNGFTYSSNLLCDVAGTVGGALRAGVCDITATLLPGAAGSTVVSAMTTAMCTLDKAASRCSPQLKAGTTIIATGTGQVTVSVDNSGAVPVQVVESYSNGDRPLLVTSLNTPGQPSTLLTGLLGLGLQSGSLQFSLARDTDTPSLYSGSVVINLFKGGPI